MRDEMKKVSKTKTLLIVLVIMVGGMTAFEVVKQFVYADLGIWESHTITIVFSTIIGLVCANFLFDKFVVFQKSHFKTDEALRTSEERFRVSQVYANIGTWEWDIESGGLYWSDQIATLFGYEPGQVETTYENFMAAVHPDDRDLVSSAVQSSLDDPFFKYELDHRVVWDDGSVHWLHEKGEVIRGDDGTPLKMLGVVTDINARKNSEEELAQSERNLAAAQRIAGVGSFAVYVDTGEATWSDERYRIFGFKPGEVEANIKNFQNSLHPDDRDRVMSAFKKTSETGKRLNIETRILRPNGEEAHVHVLGEMGKDPEGHALMTGTVMDVTERKQARSTVRKLSRVLEQSPSAVFITDTQGIIEYVNPQFSKLTGYREDEAIGQNPRIIKSNDTPVEVHSEIWKTILSGKEWRGELKDTHKDGSAFWAFATIAPVRDDDGVITNFVAIHDDITQRKNDELAVQSALEHADVASRAKTDLMANMSHELRTPLNAIIGFSGTMKEEVFGPIGNEKYAEYLDDIHHSGQHLLDLINDILDVSAIEAGAVELYENKARIVDLIDASVRIIRPRADEGRVTISVSISPQMPCVFVDERRIKQIFLNLLSNAVKFTPEGGEVSVTSWSNDDGTLSIAVGDTGIGMNEIEIEKAMSKFGQVDSGLDRKHEGTGLGLPLTLGLVECHGGTFDIKSEVHKGTQITVTLPSERVVHDDD